MRRRRRERRRKLSLFRLINRLLFLGIGISLLFALLRVQDMDEDLPTFINHGLKAQSSDLPKVSVDDWELTLINDIQVDSRIAENTRQFLAAARAIAPEETLISGYRSRAEQTELYEEALTLAEEEGLSRQEAEQEVQKRIQLPGASEHQTGLAIDMSEPEGQEDGVANKIAEIAPKYGFILRYPEGKSDITGVNFENWHYRYVGVESAQYMQKHHLVLEEYLTLLKESAR